MRKLVAAMILLLATAAVARGEGECFGFLTNGSWYIDTEIYSRDVQEARFRRNDLPGDTVFYRQQAPTKYFFGYYPAGEENIVMLGHDYNKDGRDDALKIISRAENSYFMLVQPEDPYLLLSGGTRVGPAQYPDHPFVGVWRYGGGLTSEVRLVPPGEYRFFMELSRIRGYGIRDGWYFLKYLGNNVFESDDTFEDGRIRLEVKSEKEIILTPLFTLPKSEGITAPVRLRARG